MAYSIPVFLHNQEYGFLRNTIAVTENLDADLDYPNSMDLIVEDNVKICAPPTKLCTRRH